MRAAVSEKQGWGRGGGGGEGGGEEVCDIL